MAHETPPQWDRDVRQRLLRGEAAALSEVYDRFAALAHGIAQRVLEGWDDEAAPGRVTREVFALLWSAPEDFDPGAGPLRSWIASRAHGLAVAELRRGAEEDPALGPAAQAARIRAASTAARADYILTAMPTPLRAALEHTRYQHLDAARTAARLGITEPETHRRLRLGLQLLSSARGYAAEAEPGPLPGTGPGAGAETGGGPRGGPEARPGAES
ncbi:sigma factor [Streptomyces sp. DSM 44917]|uniref:Sigma factor n=1 Tax=Streptomyces boetiae TaxID=3075541 RepID=A0ABU2L1V6_9ACTN|nr:sigma factor [Streptomyces sp. DSM 44917]MDT0305362.1 sigma factor [Streptomyces sp. DSM 44917]